MLFCFNVDGFLCVGLGMVFVRRVRVGLNSTLLFLSSFFSVCESWETSSACRSHSPSRRHIIYQKGWRGRENDVNNESQQIPSGHQRKHKSTQTSRKVLTLVFHFDVDSKRNQTKVRRKSLKQTLVTRSPVLIQVRLWVNNIRQGASTWAPTFLPSASSNLLQWSCRHTHTKHQKPQTFVWAFLSAFFGWGAAARRMFGVWTWARSLSHSLTSNVISFLCISCAFGIISPPPHLFSGLWRLKFFFLRFGWTYAAAPFFHPLSLLMCSLWFTLCDLNLIVSYQTHAQLPHKMKLCCCCLLPLLRSSEKKRWSC